MRFAPVLVLALLGACQEQKPPEKKPQGSLLPKDWVAVGFEDVVLAVPKSFTREPARDYEKGQRLFFGPEERGFKPQVQILRQPFKGTAEVWFDRWRQKYEKGPRGITKVIESGRAQVAGRSGHLLVYQLPSKNRIFVFMAWLWVHEGHGYIVRGLAEKESFAMYYRPVFEQVSRTVRLKP